MTDTLRAHLKAIIAERDRVQSGDIFEEYVLSMRRVTAHADDALAILDAAERETIMAGLSMVREWEEPTDRIYIDDPEPSA